MCNICAFVLQNRIERTYQQTFCMCMVFSTSPQHLGTYKAAKINTQNVRFERACVQREQHFGLSLWFKALTVLTIFQ